MFEHPDEQVFPAKLADHHCRERSIGSEVGAEQDAADVEVGTEEIAAGLRRDVKHRDRVANERQGGPDPVVTLLSKADGEVADLTPRCRPQRGQVDRQSLLQLPGAARRDQGRARRATADVDEQARAIGLGSGAGEGRSCGPRSARRANRGDDDDATVHGCAGLT